MLFWPSLTTTHFCQFFSFRQYCNHVPLEKCKENSVSINSTMNSRKSTSVLHIIQKSAREKKKLHHYFESSIKRSVCGPFLRCQALTIVRVSVFFSQNLRFFLRRQTYCL
jgi:hypothetical protein